MKFLVFNMPHQPNVYLSSRTTYPSYRILIYLLNLMYLVNITNHKLQFFYVKYSKFLQFLKPQFEINNFESQEKKTAF